MNAPCRRLIFVFHMVALCPDGWVSSATRLALLRFPQNLIPFLAGTTKTEHPKYPQIGRSKWSST